jgi:hypothetical protein
LLDELEVTVLRRLFSSGLLLSPLVATWNGCGCGGGTSRVSTSTAVVDPWQAKLDQMRKEYAANESKMLADWRGAVKDAQAGDLDATKLDHEIKDLRQEVERNRQVLTNWDAQLADEVARRSAAKTGS